MSREVNPERHGALIRYLLEQVNERERAAIEDALLAEADFQEDLDVAEEDLAERYVSGNLSTAERTLVEEKFGGSPEWKATIETARALDHVAAEMAQMPSTRVQWVRRPALRLAPMAVAAAVVLIGLWLLFRPGDSQRRGVQVARGPSPAMPSFLLAPTLKGGTPQTDNVVQLTSPPVRIELRLPLEQNLYPVYQLKLESLATGATTLLGNAAAVHVDTGAEVRVTLDASGLQPGRYTLVLQAAEAGGGITEVAGFTFRVGERQ